MRTLLIDSDIVAYKVAAHGEDTFDFDGDGDLAVHLDEQAALKKCDTVINEYADQLKADRVAICLSDPNANFRKELWPQYKANRIGARKPTLLFAMKEYMRDQWPSYIRPRLEADDVMGILATHPTLIEGEKVIVSEDKDMQCIPGLLFNPRKDEDVREISPVDADRYFLWQAIVGDAADGYPGAKRKGPKSPEAQAVLTASTLEEAWQCVYDAHHKVQRKENPSAPADEINVAAFTEALLMARLARILRHGDFNYQTKKIRLWKPPTGVMESAT